jgi:hypothetical protein
LQRVAAGQQIRDRVLHRLATGVLQDTHVRLALAVLDGGQYALARAIELATLVLDNQPHESLSSTAKARRARSPRDQ